MVPPHEPLEIPPLPESTILLVEVGSTAHGTGLPGGEDHDELEPSGRWGAGGAGQHPRYDTKCAMHSARLG
ncbi:MAG: hypothetical protein ACRD2W_14375 [Acidimicrobiales bacterium]